MCDEILKVSCGGSDTMGKKHKYLEEINAAPIFVRI